MDLEGQFLGWNKDGHTRSSILLPSYLLKNWKCIRSSLSSSGLSYGDQVVTRQDLRDGLDLDGCRRNKPQIPQSIEELPGQFQIHKLHDSKVGGNVSCGMLQEDPSGLDFSNMAPLSGEKAEVAMRELLSSRNWESDLAKLVPLEAAKSLVERWQQVQHASDFQSEVVKPFLDHLMSATTGGVTWNSRDGGLDQGMLFLSNHRDIVLDPSLINVALMEAERGSTEIGIGSNLLSSDWIRDLVRLNRCFVVHRSGSMREKYMHSMRTASYIRHVIEKEVPVWLAHREGRAKDGVDRTSPALVRTLSNGNNPEIWNALQVVPVSISYEWDPCDSLKVHEVLSVAKHGSYTKKPGEDELSMWRGMIGQKGRVHLTFHGIMPWASENMSERPERAMAASIDRKLLGGMKIWPNQRLAAESLGLANAICDLGPEVNDHDVTAFETRMRQVTQELNVLGWSKEEGQEMWCKVISAPLVDRASHLEEVGHGNGSG